MTALPRRPTVRVLLVALLAGAAFAWGAVAGTPTADAHPLGNLSVNHLSTVSVSSDTVDVRYFLDMAEVPTFQDRALSDSQVLAGVESEVLQNLELTVDGRPAPLEPLDATELSHPPGQGGLDTTRVELPLVARIEDPSRVELRDGTYPGRVGWRAIVARPGEGTSVRSTAPSTDPTEGLRSYPEGTLSEPLDQRTASLTVEPGDGTLTAPREEGGAPVSTESGEGGGLADVFARAAAGEGVFVLLLLAAFAWGGVHALSPGHGKAMVAAYLVGTRGTPRHAAALGLTVTVTHTLGVFALGLVTLALAQYVLPEDLYPWLTLLSGLLVVAVGASLVRSRLRWARRGGGARGEEQARNGHGHRHHHASGHDPPTRRGLIAMGASAGLIPCPTALVVLLAAIAQAQIGLGLLLIVAFSAGLAATLTLLGIVVVYAGRLSARLKLTSRAARYLPAVSTVAILALGLAMTMQAVPEAL